jgi:hypothetical protein
MKRNLKRLVGLGLILLGGCIPPEHPKPEGLKFEDLGNGATRATFPDGSYRLSRSFYNEKNEYLGQMSYFLDNKAKYSVTSIASGRGSLRFYDLDLDGETDRIIASGEIADEILEEAEEETGTDEVFT